jgi:hypothetical protein
MVYTEQDAVNPEGERVDPATDVTNLATDVTHPAREVANQTMEHATLTSHDWTTYRLEVSSSRCPGTAFTNISTIFLSFFYLFSIFFLNGF